MLIHRQQHGKNSSVTRCFSPYSALRQSARLPVHQHAVRCMAIGTCASCNQCSRTPKPSTSAHWPRAANMHTQLNCIRTDTHIPFNALCPGLPRWAGTRKVKPIWILLKQETVSGSGISWAICKSAPHSRQITTPTPHRSVFLQAGCPSCCPTNSVKALKANVYVQR